MVAGNTLDAIRIFRKHRDPMTAEDFERHMRRLQCTLSRRQLQRMLRSLAAKGLVERGIRGKAFTYAWVKE